MNRFVSTNTGKRQPFRFAVTVFLYGLAGVVLLVTAPLHTHRLPSYSFEVIVYGLLFVPAFRYNPFRHAIREAPPAVLLAMGVLFLGALWAQMAGEPQKTYPLVPWTMYTQREPVPEYWLFEIERVDGSRLPLIPRRHPLRIRSFQGHLILTLLTKNHQEPSPFPYSFEELVLGALRSRRDLDLMDIQAVEAIQVTIPPSFTGGINAKQFELIRRWTLAD